MVQQLSKDRRRHLQIFFVCLGVFLFINIFSSTDYHSLSVVVNLRMVLGCPPRTSLVIPPIGEIRANTHWLPVRLSLELKNVNLSLLRSIVFSNPEATEPLFTELEDGVRRLAVYFVIKLVGLGVFGAVFSLVFLGVRDQKHLIWGGLAGVLVVALLVSTLYFTYDLRAFERLEYEGIIEAAPWALSLAWQALGQVEELGARVQVLARNLYSALQQLETLGPIGLVEADLVAVHVSDIHNNPVAYDFARQVIESFPVDFVLDTGDLTDWGTALEAEVTRRIEELQVPYVFVSGNHESLEVLNRLRMIENVIVVDQTETKLLGLRIAGSGDLAAQDPLPTPAPVGDLGAQAQDINSRWANVEDRPDIFMVHNHRVAKAVDPGLFPVVLYGHTHVLDLQQVDGTVYNTAGTTGAAGIRGFQSKEPLPYSLSLLYFVQNEQGRPILVAVDGVHVAGFGQSFSLQRTFIEYGRNLTQDVEMVR